MARRKKAASKQSQALHPLPKQPTPKQPPSKQPPPKKPLPKQPPPKQTTPKQTTPKRPTPKRPAPKQPAPKQPAPKQPAPKQPITKHLPTPKQTSPSVSTKSSITKGFNPLDYVTKEELLNIDAQFNVSLKGVDVVLFWTGVHRPHVDRWAKMWRLTTLTVAMGPLMDSADPNSPKSRKGEKAYSKYVKAASGQFAHYARQHCRVVVLTNPPPNIYSIRDNNTYQQLEEPILKGLFGDTPVRRIDYIHPNVNGAAHVTYQTWPYDKSHDWAIPFSCREIKVWKRLNWSYKSLITTSQLCLNSQQPPPLSIASKPHALPAQSSRQLGHGTMNPPSVSNEIRNLNIDNANKEHILTNVQGANPPQRCTDLVEEVRHPSPGLGIQGHESQPIPVEPGPPTNSDSCLVDPQVDQKSYYHDQELLKKDSLPIPAYTIKRCEMPKPPITVPVVSIDDIAVGCYVTIDIEEHRADKDFIYLTMKGVCGIKKWWRLRWIDG